MSTEKNTKFTPYQFLLVGTLALVLFTIVLDFMVISALSAILLPKLEITTKEFGLLVSAYPISAGISAILLSGYADKFQDMLTNLIEKNYFYFFTRGFYLVFFFVQMRLRIRC